MTIEETLMELEKNSLFLGVLFFVYIIAGDIIFEKPKALTKYLKNNVAVRHLVVFSSAFLVTQNLKQSLILWVGYTIVFDGLLDCNSKFSVLPEDCKKFIKKQTGEPKQVPEAK